MGRSSICEKTGLIRGTWTPEEDRLLTAYIKRYGHWNWRELPKYAGLSRCGKSCRLRWMNYLRPNIKRGDYTTDEEELIINLHVELGNRWSAIAARLPGRTDNEIKNYWHTHLRKRTKKTAILKDAKSKPNVEHERLMRRGESASPNCVHPNNITPLILESSAVLPISPPKSSNFSSFSTYGFEAVISENFWTEPFWEEDSYKVDMDSNTSVFVDEYSLSPLAEALYPYNLYNGYDMDMLLDY